MPTGMPTGMRLLDVLHLAFSRYRYSLGGGLMLVLGDQYCGVAAEVEQLSAVLQLRPGRGVSGDRA